MTNATVLLVLAKYERVLDGRTRPVMLHHLQTMIPRMRDMITVRDPDAESTGKVFRWLGFIQGVLWSLGIYTIDDLREHNQGRQL